MDSGLDKVIEQLAAAGLVEAGELRSLVATIPDDARPRDNLTLVNELARRNILTPYQSRRILAGETSALSLGNYTVLDELGSGGMGQVYRALHRRMDRVVALKVLPPSAVSSPIALARFHREAKAAAKLNHPHIVTAHDAGEHEGIHFLVMEFIEGHDLAREVKAFGTLPIDQALDCTLQAAAGLEYAHRRGVYHRDIKPSNLLLSPEGTVKILDMGLSRLAHSGADDQTADDLTQTGGMMGTLDYMPPEQAEDTRKADHRSDIYSLGCTLYYLLVGRPPYKGDTTVQKILAHRDAPLSKLRDALPDAPEKLDEIFHRMIAKKPEDRYQSVRDVIADLQAARHSLSSGSDGGRRIAAAETFPHDSAGSSAFRRGSAPTAAISSPTRPLHDDTITSHQDRDTQPERDATLGADAVSEPWISGRTVWTLAVGAALLFGAYGYLLLQRGQRQEAAIGAVRELSGKVYYDFEYSGGVLDVRETPAAPGWYFRFTGSHLLDRIVCVELGGTSANDADLGFLTNLPKLEVLDLSNTKITDRGLAPLGSLSRLQWLYLQNTRIGDDGLAQLKGLEQLQLLDLSGTQVTDAGLIHLTQLPQLQRLRISETQVTSLGLTKLKNLIPNLYIEGRGEGR